MVKILDCTIRDGGHNTNWEFSDEFVLNLLECQNKSGIEYCEIGYRNALDNNGKGRFYNCTPELLKSFYEVRGNVKIGVMTDTSRCNLEDFPNSTEDYVDFVRVAGKPNEISKALTIAENLLEKGYRVFVQLMDVSSIDEIGYMTLFTWQKKDVIEGLYFADSYGKLSPDDIENYFNKLKMLGYKNLSFHAHNNINLALDNTLKAVELGAYSVDVAFFGGERYGGNLEAAELFKTLSDYPSNCYDNLNDIFLQDKFF